MIIPQEFLDRWDSENYPLIKISPKAIEQSSLSSSDKDFLLQAGWPEDAAPFLNFEPPKTGDAWPTVVKHYCMPDLQRYLYLGSDGAGNPIAIDSGSNHEIVLLDHERRFSSSLINTSLLHFAESLLAYRAMIVQAQDVCGEDAYFEGKILKTIRDSLRSTLEKIDPPAMKPGCFWYGEAQSLDGAANV